jgi:hypothetical protein
MGGSSHYCRSCGTELRAATRFCTGCGRDMQAADEGAPSAGQQHDTAETTTAAVPALPEARRAHWPESPRASRTGAASPEAPRYEEPRYEPPGRDEERSPPNRSRRLAIGGIALVVVVLAAAAVLAGLFRHSSNGASSSPTTAASAHGAGELASPASSAPGTATSSDASPTAAPTQAQAATDLAALLDRSVSDRDTVDNAYNDAKSCGPHPAGDSRTFQAAARSRRQLLRELAVLPGRQTLPQPMLADLASAWHASVRADEDFAAWAQDEAEQGCSTATNQSDANYEAADGPDTQATRSKTAFIRKWNTLAEQYDLTTYQQNNF